MPSTVPAGTAVTRGWNPKGHSGPIGHTTGVSGRGPSLGESPSRDPRSYRCVLRLLGGLRVSGVGRRDLHRTRAYVG